MVRAQRGDARALVSILKRFEPLVRRCCRGLSEMDRQDLEQDLCLLICQIALTYPLPEGVMQNQTRPDSVYVGSAHELGRILTGEVGSDVR